MMIQRKLKYAIFFAILILLFIISALISVPYKMIPAENGTLDLSGQNLNEKVIFKLDGQWEFFWSKLLDERNLCSANPDLYVKVPDTWNKYEMNGKKLPGQGYATYRLHIVTDVDAGTRLGLRIKTFSSAYQLYIDDKLIASAGQPAKSAGNEIGRYKPQTVFFSGSVRRIRRYCPDIEL